MTDAREIIARALDPTIYDDLPPHENYQIFMANAVIDSLVAAGFAVVPAEPTGHMCEVGRQSAHGGAVVTYFDCGNARCVYRAMLAAAEKQEA